MCSNTSTIVGAPTQAAAAAECNIHHIDCEFCHNTYMVLPWSQPWPPGSVQLTMADHGGHQTLQKRQVAAAHIRSRHKFAVASEQAAPMLGHINASEMQAHATRARNCSCRRVDTALHVPGSLQLLQCHHTECACITVRIKTSLTFCMHTTDSCSSQRSTGCC